MGDMSLEEQVEKRETRPRAPYMKPTDISDPDYFHKVVDCQWACPAHTPVPEYIRMIAQQRYTEAYMINWESNVFPGVLGRTCDRPCEPACRRGRIEEKPVARKVALTVTSETAQPDERNGVIHNQSAPPGQSEGLCHYNTRSCQTFRPDNIA